MTNVLAMRIACAFGCLAVALGAFGAHALKGILETHDRVATWDTAVFYHFIHAVMLFVVAARTPFARGPWFLFLLGILVFSGSLYLLSVTNVRWLGAITPVGGVCFLLGWLWLLVCARPPR
ncbi:MAG TPA: DUF423 domain-containing protein [Verrucomicrobia bacterium]|nr:DUF423 domain-containing protein [Verrucomicrobiota bacterium]HOB32114.1 DUF423 domain-containing protein [Verrucomicrobiota bacterium]HOP96810.1 DUF423 domain-containing protein [Verrucomicrobiota bacterium]HPU56024.1 DUF423 domain-containing protein [Verrucomicrobiota bacterium]